MPDIGLVTAATSQRRPPEPPNDRPLIAGLIVAFAFAAECGAAYSAWRLHYDSALGPPAIVIPATWVGRLTAFSILFGGIAVVALVSRRAYRLGVVGVIVAVASLIASRGYVYSPTQPIKWQLKATDHFVRHVVLQGWILAAAVALSLSFFLIVVWRRRVERTRATTSHGSASWGDPASLAVERGLVVGRAGNAILRLDGEGHVLTVAPTRSGKGVSGVIPNLLDHPGSALVTDPKGENYAVTSSWRRKAGHDVYALDPFDLVDGQAAYNPVDLVDISSPDAADDARMLADMLVLPEGKEAADQSFWNEEARGLITGLILHAASSARPELRTLTEVRDLLTQPPDSFRALLTAMSANTAADGLVARAAARIMQKADRERSGVISTAQSHTHFLDSPRMKRVLGSSSFDFASLKRDPTTATRGGCD